MRKARNRSLLGACCGSVTLELATPLSQPFSYGYYYYINIIATIIDNTINITINSIICYYYSHFRYLSD